MSNESKLSLFFLIIIFLLLAALMERHQECFDPFYTYTKGKSEQTKVSDLHEESYETSHLDDGKTDKDSGTVSFSLKVFPRPLRYMIYITFFLVSASISIRITKTLTRPDSKRSDLQKESCETLHKDQ